MSSKHPMRLDIFTDRVLSIAATIVAAAALGTSLYEARITREQQKIAVWPYLTDFNTDSGGRYGRHVQNVGLGPALVEWSRVYVDGRPQRTWGEVLRSLDTGFTARGSTYSHVGAGSVLTPGANLSVIDLPDSADIRRMHASVARLETRYCYCSLYGECWIAGSEATHPERTDGCVADSTLDFRQ